MTKTKAEQPANLPTNLRRNFLLGATLGSAGAVAAVVTGGANETLDIAVPGATVVAVQKVKGYHLSEHITQYYDTTRI